MFASRRGLSAQDIRDWMGEFSDIKILAKYAARLGQSLAHPGKLLVLDRMKLKSFLM